MEKTIEKSAGGGTEADLELAKARQRTLRSKLPPLKPGEDPLAIFRFGGVKVLGDIVSPTSEWELE